MTAPLRDRGLSPEEFVDEVPLGPAERAIGDQLADEHDRGIIRVEAVPRSEQARCAEWSDAVVDVLERRDGRQSRGVQAEVSDCRRVEVQLVRDGKVVARPDFENRQGRQGAPCPMKSGG